MILPALLCNGKKKLKVNAMVDPCSTGSYVTENAAEELKLFWQRTGPDNLWNRRFRSEEKFPSRTLECCHKTFVAKIQANVLDNITGDTPAFPWAKLKDRWPHL